MQNLYFACCDCKIHIDAGYRWAYLTLEKVGIVNQGKQIDVDSVLRAESYWNLPQEEKSRWLYEEIFPPLRQFLQQHKSHRIIFGDDEEFAPFDSDDFWDWMQIGYLVNITPRYLVERLGLETWEQVEEYMRRQRFTPVWWELTWWGDPSPHEKGKRKFEDLVRAKHGG